MRKPLVGAVIAAGGMAQRMQGIDKQQLVIGGVPVLARSILALGQVEQVGEIVVVTKPELFETLEGWRERYHLPPFLLAAGGSTRQQSVQAGVAMLSEQVEYVAIHDGARPFATRELIERCLQSAIEHEESAARTSYDDEAIADENYYELEADENGGPVRPPEEAEEERGADAHEETAGAGESAPSACAEQQSGEGAESGEKPIKCATSAFHIGGSPEEEGEEFRAEEDDEPAQPKLAGGGFYERMSGDIKKIFSTYPRAEALEDVIDGSRWAKITYGNGAHYAFGVIYDGGNAKYLCYGVPVAPGAPCPESLKGRAAYVPVDGGGYWVMYQDANTGISIKAK